MDEYTPHFNEFIEYEHLVDHTGVFPTAIETDTFVLKPLLNFDYLTQRELLQIYQDNEGTDKYFTSEDGLPQSYSELTSFVEAASVWAEEEETDMFYAMYRNDDMKFLGQATIEDVDWEVERCSIGIWLREEAWGQGLSQKRAEALLYTIFDDWQFEVVEIAVVPMNRKSIRAVEKYVSVFGGSYDGRRRKAAVTPTGDVYDVAYYSVTRDEFFSDEETPISELSGLQ